MTSRVGDTAVDPVAGPREEAVRGLEHEVATLIRRVRRVTAERAHAVDERLQSSSYLMLSWLVDNGPVRASVMVESFHVDKAAVSRQLHHLVELGLVDRTPDPEDGRATLVSASDSAVRRLDAVTAERRRSFDDRLNGWDTDELDEFVSLLSRYNASLEAPAPGDSGARAARASSLAT